MFKKIIAKFLVFIFLVFSCFSEIPESVVLKSIEKMKEIIPDGMKKADVPGSIFVVSRNNKVIYYQAFGKTIIGSNNSNNKDANNSTVFPVSSVTKTVTSFLVGALVDDGKINWDGKLRKYIPDFFLHSEELSNKLTILDLVSHSSGFHHFSGDSLYKSGYDKQKIVDIFKYIKQKPGEFRKNYGYQNVVFGLIGDILEKATGEKYEDLIKHYIFDKMDFKNSSAISLSYESSRFGHFKYLISRFSHDKSKVGFFKALWGLIKDPFVFRPKEVTVSHSRYQDKVNPLPEIGHFHVFPATSGISFSSEEFGKFLEMICNRGKYKNIEIVSSKTFDKITSNIVDIKNIKDDDLTFIKERYSRDDMHYGAGVYISKYGDNGKNEREIIYHMGGIYGSSAFFAISLDDNISVGFISNLGGVANTLFSEYMVNQFLDLCFGFSDINWIQKELDRKNYIKEMMDSYHDDLSNQNPAPHLRLEKYTGIYTSDIYGDIKITNNNGTLTIDNGIKKANLKHINRDIFTFPSKDMLFNYSDQDEYASFFKDESSNIDSVYISCFDENKTIFKRKR